MSAAEDRIQGKFASDQEHAKLYTELLQLASNVDVETRRIWQTCDNRKQAQGEPTAVATGADEHCIDKFLSAQATSPAFPPSGSAAVTFARFEHCRANGLAKQVNQLVSERDQLLAELRTVRACGVLPEVALSQHFTGRCVCVRLF